MELTTDFGILCLIPPIVIIVTALWWRRTFEPLILGSAVAFVMADGFGFLTSLLNEMMAQLEGNSWMWMVICLLGIFSVLMTKSAGSFAIGKWLSKYANTEKKTLLTTYILGIIVFVDEYLNIITLSSTMLKVSDSHKTPREMFAYIIDSTGTPVTVLLPITSWAVFYIGLFDGQKEIADLGTGFEMYTHSIPFMFYAMAAVVMVPLVVIGIVPKLGAMKKAYKRVAEGGDVYSQYSDKFNEIEGKTDEKSTKPMVINFLLPIIVLIVLTFYTQDLVPSLAITIALQFVLYIITKAMKPLAFVESIVEGVCSMAPMLLITLGAFTVRAAMDAVELPQYVVNAVVPFITPELLPAITFVVVAALIFVVGSCWGTTAVAIPIFAPLAVMSGSSLEMTMGAMVCAATFGSHACFYTDATVLASQCSKIDNMEHALSQIPYAIISAVIATVAYVIAGYIVI